MAHVDDLLRYLKEHDGSDLHLAAGLEPRIRRYGKLERVADSSPLVDSELRSMLREIAIDRHWKEYDRTRDVDFAYGLEGVGRFRANYFVQHHGSAAVFRIIPEEILTFEDLQLPEPVEKLVDLDQGLVLVTGPTGSGKSTTLAAIIDKINRTYAKHVVTIEDPVEFMHPNRKSVFSHREVGLHTCGFEPALRAAIRQDADVVLVGDIRDRETIALALTAAEMGLLVFGTLHTNSAAKTIDRIVDAFPAEEHGQVRISLSESLAGIVSQLLLPTPGGKGRCAVNEILLRTPGLPNVIREGNTPMLHSIIQSGKALGMQSMDDALFAKVAEGKVEAQDAYLKANDKSRFEALISPNGDA